MGGRHAGGRDHESQWQDVVKRSRRDREPCPRVVERFTPVNGDRINYQATVSDPMVYTRPWTTRLPLNRQKEELLEVACHEDNQDLQHLKESGTNIEKKRVEQTYEVVMGRMSFVGIVTALFLHARPAVAHHSFSAEYDEKKPLKLTGTVSEMRWSNPHAWIYIDVRGKTVRS